MEEEPPSQSLCQHVRSNNTSILCLFPLTAEDSTCSSYVKCHPPSCSNLWLDSLYRLRSFLSHHVSLTRCRYRCPSQTIALGSFYHYAVHTQWLLCSRSSTGPKSECWKPSVYASAALSLWCPPYRCPPTGTSRCPVYRRFLVNRWKKNNKVGKKFVGQLKT